MLAALSILLLVIFIHALARSMVSETAIERVGREPTPPLANWSRTARIGVFHSTSAKLLLRSLQETR